ncbi:hypothetical protein [Nonomuraea typhae]|uniref:hypothetical protein n=1 Tax=Nonomuraea typhae TaxID=2603600 RepID=UPI0012FA1378|nr:hypothetical protein [Nonomuraea typhae]
MFRALRHVVRRHWLRVLGVLLNLTPIAWAGELLVGILQGLSSRNREFSLLIRRARGARPPAVSSEAGRALLGVRDFELPRPDVRLVVALRATAFVLAVEGSTPLAVLPSDARPWPRMKVMTLVVVISAMASWLRAKTLPTGSSPKADSAGQWCIGCS